MCLATKEDRQVAKEDIICYKVLRCCGLKSRLFGIYETPFMNRLVFIKRMCNAKGRDDVFTMYGLYTHSKQYIVEGGFIHTYKTLRRGELFLSENHTCKYQIFECIIPKGTAYYESESDYASKRIKFIKKIKHDR